MQNGMATWKMVWWFLAKLNILMPHDPAVAHLGIYPKKLKAYIHTKACTQMFTVVLFTTEQANLERLHMIPMTWHPGNGKTVETIKR